jgi:serine/threonine protein kinase
VSRLKLKDEVPMADIRSYEPLWGAWKVVELIGEGAFGKVYHISREDFGKTYHAAVKMISIPESAQQLKSLRIEMSGDESVKAYCRSIAEDFSRELETLSKLQGHSNIVGYQDHMIVPAFGGVGYDILLRMELLESLTDHISKAPMTEQEVIKLGLNICSALEICSHYSIIHRDLKIENIFISSYGDYKLGDFGIARQLDRTDRLVAKRNPLVHGPRALQRNYVWSKRRHLRPWNIHVPLAE